MLIDLLPFPAQQLLLHYFFEESNRMRNGDLDSRGPGAPTVEKGGAVITLDKHNAVAAATNASQARAQVEWMSPSLLVADDGQARDSSCNGHSSARRVSYRQWPSLTRQQRNKQHHTRSKHVAENLKRDDAS